MKKLSRQTRFTLLLLALLLVLATAWYLWRGQKAEALGGARETAFSISDTAGLTEITLTRNFSKLGKTETLTLKRTPEGWVVNNRFPASPRRMQDLLATLAHIQVREVVAPSAVNNAFKIIQSAHVEVKLTGKREKRNYFIGPAPPDKKGSLAYLAGSRLPCIVELPGLQGTLAPQFSTTLADWRDLVLLNGTAENLKTVQVQYAGADSSFTLHKQPNGIWKLDGNTPTDTVRTQLYLSLMGTLYASKRAEDISPGQFDQLRKQTPHARIRLTDTLGTTQTLTLVNTETLVGQRWAWRADRMELMLAQDFVFNPLLITRQHLIANSPKPLYIYPRKK